jgi:hypothetical protein
MTVTSGMSAAQVSAVRGPDRSDSQADSASSILVTRSDVKAQVSGHARYHSLARRVLLISMHDAGWGDLSALKGFGARGAAGR